MRHLKAGRKLGVTSSHRKAMMRNMVTSLLEHGQITTTLAKAKEVRRYCEKIITLAKKQNLASNRRIFGYIRTKDAGNRLLDELVDLYKDRNGGYTRIMKLDHRLGDNAQKALIQLVDFNLGESSNEDKEEKVDSIKEIQEDLGESAKAE